MPPLAWTSEGHGLLVWNRTLPAHIDRIEVGSGRRERVQEIAPADPVGLLYGFATFSSNGRYHVMRYRKVLSQLYLVDLQKPFPDVFVGVKIGEGTQ